MKLKAHQQHTLKEIETVCYNRKIKLTPQRKIVLSIMLKAEKAMSAYYLLDLLKAEQPQAKPPTIYRALDFLLEQGFIHRVESSNSYIICPHFCHPNHLSVLLICDNCKQIEEKHNAEIEMSLQLSAADSHFKMRQSVIEIHGTCSNCQVLSNSSLITDNLTTKE